MFYVSRIGALHAPKVGIGIAPSATGASDGRLAAPHLPESHFCPDAYKNSCALISRIERAAFSTVPVTLQSQNGSRVVMLHWSGGNC